MEKNYYPLHCGKITAGWYITTQVDIENLAHAATSDCIIAERLPEDLAQQIVDSYNEKYGPRDKMYWPLIIVTGNNSVYSNRHLTIKANDLLDDVYSQHEAENVMDRIYPMLEKSPVVVTFQTNKGILWEILAKKADVAICDLPEKSAHSFTQGSDPIPDPEYSIDEQLEAIRQWIDIHNYAGSPSMRVKDPGILWAIQKNLQAVKRWRESPVMHDIDCEKVIGDLCDYVRETQSHTPPCLQNGEAALGMLRALKEKRDKREFKCHAHIQKEPNSSSQPKFYHVEDCGPLYMHDLTNNKFFVTENGKKREITYEEFINTVSPKTQANTKPSVHIPISDRDAIVTEIRDSLVCEAFSYKQAFTIANGIMSAIEAVQHIQSKNR